MLMHTKPHLDEIMGRVVAMIYGKNIFLGIDKAPVIFLEGDLLGNNDLYDYRGDLPIGCGEGARFNEHLVMGGRIKDESSTSLIARALGLRDYPVLKELVDEVTYFDNNTGASQTMLGNLVKTAHAFYKDGSKVMDIFTLALHAIILCKQYSPAEASDEMTPSQLLANFLAKNPDKFPKDATDRVAKLFASSVYSKRITELGNVIRCLYRAGRIWGQGNQRAEDFFGFVLNILVSDYLAFNAEVEYIREGITPFGILTKTKRGERRYRSFAMWSNSPRSQKAARRAGAHIVLIGNSQKNYQIYTSNRLPPGSLNYVLCMLRTLETGEKNPNWTVMKSQGYAFDGDIWYGHNGSIYNGTLTHRVRSSSLPMAAIKEVLQYGFHPEGITTWCKKHKITPRFSKPAEIVEIPTDKPIITVGEADEAKKANSLVPA